MIWVILVIYVVCVAALAYYTTPPSTLKNGPWMGGRG